MRSRARRMNAMNIYCGVPGHIDAGIVGTLVVEP
jgi:uncharacterized cupredoxin-like copper-binding protein